MPHMHTTTLVMRSCDERSRARGLARSHWTAVVACCPGVPHGVPALAVYSAACCTLARLGLVRDTPAHYCTVAHHVRLAARTARARRCPRKTSRARSQPKLVRCLPSPICTRTARRAYGQPASVQQRVRRRVVTDRCPIEPEVRATGARFPRRDMEYNLLSLTIPSEIGQLTRLDTLYGSTAPAPNSRSLRPRMPMAAAAEPSTAHAALRSPDGQLRGTTRVRLRGSPVLPFALHAHAARRAGI